MQDMQYAVSLSLEDMTCTYTLAVVQYTVSCMLIHCVYVVHV